MASHGCLDEGPREAVVHVQRAKCTNREFSLKNPVHLLAGLLHSSEVFFDGFEVGRLHEEL